MSPHAQEPGSPGASASAIGASSEDELARLRAELAAARAELAAARTRQADDEMAWWSPLLAERAVCGILVGALGGRIIRANAKAQAILGYDESEIGAVHYSHFTHPDDRAESVRLVRETIAGERDGFEVRKRLVRKDGAERWVDMSFSIVRDAEGRAHHSLAMLTDVTEQELALRALRDSEACYRQLVEHDPAAIAVQTDGLMIFVNPAGIRLFGARDASELIGRPALDFVPEAHRERVAARFRDAAEPGEPAAWERSWIRALDGREFPIEAVRVRIPFQGKSSVLSIVRDVSDEERLERSLQAQMDKLRELDGLKSQFVSIVSHELRTPLTSIKGYAEFLEDELAGALGEPQREFVRQIARNTQQLERLVDDLLDYSRITAGTFKLAPVPTDFAQVARDVAEDQSVPYRQAGIALALSLGTGPLRLLADPQRLGQVLVNLLTNARKFTPPGGRVAVRAWLDGEALCCEVADSGPGVPAAERERVFQRFLQLDGTNTREASGLGLGLAICRSIVESHGGRIGVDDAPDGGARFWFTVPLAPGGRD